MRPNIDTIRARRADIARQLASLQSEDAELASAETVLARLSQTHGAKMNGARVNAAKMNGAKKIGAKRNGPSLVSKGPSAKSEGWKAQAVAGLKRRGRPPAGAKTMRAGAAKKAARGRKKGANGDSQRELVLAALKSSKPAWQNIRQIIANVKHANGVAIPPRSLSPLLSNLKKSGAIVRNGRLVAVPERGRGRD